MSVTFRLADGTRAGIVPTRDLRARAVKQHGLEWVGPGADVPVVFYVRNQAALDRVFARFGAPNHAGNGSDVEEGFPC